MNRTQRPGPAGIGRPAPGPVTNMPGPAGRAWLAGLSLFLAHPWRWHRRPCTGRVYAARVALEVIVLLAVIAALAAVPWFRHEPALARFAIAAVPCAISAATAATIRRQAGPRRGSRAMTSARGLRGGTLASELRDRGRVAAGEACAVTKPSVAPNTERRRPAADTVVRRRLFQTVTSPPNLAG